jgi:predicted RNase H-like nuclease (RuvC/YqgF family)
MVHLKKDNKLLQRENSELKDEITRLKEESKDKEEKWRNFILAAEDQRANLESTTKEQDIKVQQLESEVSH